MMRHTRNNIGLSFAETAELQQLTAVMTNCSGGRQGSDKNFPSKARPLFIPSDTAYVYFESDGSNNDWGTTNKSISARFSFFFLLLLFLLLPC